MPKIVDPHERRQAVAEAVFRVIERHYFASHAELMEFAMRAMVERVSARLVTHADRLLAAATPLTWAEQREAVVAMLAEVLPLDEERRRECVVWLAFVTAARTRPELRASADQPYDDMVELTTRVLRGAERAGALRDDVDIDLEARRLCAVLDGLSLHGVLHPTRLDPDTTLAVLRRHLAGLAREQS